MEKICNSTLTVRDMAPMIYAATQYIVFDFRGSHIKCDKYLLEFTEIFLPAPYHAK